MMKRLVLLLAVCALTFAPLSLVGIDEVDAKGYKSGKKSFSPGANNKDQMKKQDQNNNVTKATPAKPNNKGGLARGLLLGGLGGLLLGSMFAGLGILGPILSFMINMLFYFAIFMLILKLYQMFKKRREKHTW